jgi:hypothetical protein
VQDAIDELVDQNKFGDKQIDEHYMLFLFKIYDSEQGIQNVCKSNSLKQELLNFYIQKEDNEQVLEVCKGEAFIVQHNEPVNGDLWIQALTYFRDQQGSEEEMKQALEEIRKKNILSPLLVLEILKENPKLKFGVLRNFLLQSLKTQ